MPSEKGGRAPEFGLDSTLGRKIRLKDYRGDRWVVLYFYPRDNTSGCTAEACDFRDQWVEFDRVGATVLGVSPDSIASHQAFAERHQLPFPLLSDPDKTALQAYGVWKEKSLYGRKFMGVERSTFLISPEGKIVQAWRKVKVPGHVAAVLKTLNELRSSKA